jgi:hypothetical protein
MKQVEPFLELLESLRIQINAVGVVLECTLEILQGAGDLFMAGNERLGGGVEPLEFVEGSTQGTRLCDQGRFILLETLEGRLDEVESLGGVAGAEVILRQGFLFLGLKPGGFDFLDLMAE